jgi:hypothetical protein
MNAHRLLRHLFRVVAVVPLLVASSPGHSLEFEVGLNFTACTLSDCGGIPPDTMGAVGEAHIVQLINSEFRVFRKSDGMLLQSKPDFAFWADAGLFPSFPFDPRVAYDASTQRWFALEVDDSFSPNGFLVAVSSTPDPTQGWTAFRIDSDSTDESWADFPMLGVDADGVYLSANMFTLDGFFTGLTTLVVLPKADLLAAAPGIANGTIFERVPFGDLGFSPQLTLNLDGTGGPMPIVGGFGTFIHVGAIVGPITSPTLAFLGPAGLVELPFFDGDPPNAEQPGELANIEIIDSRFTSNLVLRNGRLWGARTVRNAGRAVVEWFQFDPATRTVLQFGLIADQALDLYYPSIAVNEFEQVVISFNGSSEAQFVSIYAVAGETEGGSTTFGAPVLLKEGVGPYEIVVDGRNRWGDYSATVVDPADPRMFWTFQEWADLGNSYGTQITQIRVLADPAPCPWDLSADTQVDAADLAQLLGAWGPNPGHPADFNADDTVDAADLAQLLGAWGSCP